MLVTIQADVVRDFQVSSAETILDGALREGINFPYSCRNGLCSACKCKVLKGETVPLGLEQGISGPEKKEGWILACVRSLKTDIILEVELFDGIELPVPKTLPCRISGIQILAPGVIQVFLRLPPTVDFYFIPGQYIEVIGNNGVRRSYSLANSILSEKVLELHIREVSAGVMSGYWFHEAKINDLLRLNGPLGTFFLRDVSGIDLIFLATGTGIAPLKAMLESVDKLPVKSKPKSVTLLWGVRTSQDLYLDVGGVRCEYSFEFIPVLSSPDDGWSGATGYVQDVLLERFQDWNNAAVYACGSNDMICDSRKRILAAGLPSGRFYSDAFVSSATE